MISIQYEDSFLIVVSKPAGVSVHNDSPSLLEWLKAKNKPVNFVNRLDTETSGLVLVAKDPEIHLELQDSLAEGTKIYRALLRTGWKNPNKKFNWDLPLSDKAEGYKNPRGLSKDQKPCHSFGEVVRTNKYFTEVMCQIKTGRQHQIRKHASIAKHPVVGDKRYNEDKYNQNIFKLYNVNRMFLHSEVLQFRYNNKNYEFTDTSMNLDKFFVETDSL